MANVQDLRPFVSDIAEVEQTARGLRLHRLPPWVRRQFPEPQLLAMESQPSGVRLGFRTTGRRLELTLHSTRLSYAGADRPRGRVDLVVDGQLLDSDELTGGDEYVTDLAAGTTTRRTGSAHVSVFDGLPVGDKRVELWLPHNETVEFVALRADAVLALLNDVGPLWVHHGSSISHGSNAASPTKIWPVVAARAAHARLRNLGLGGSALLDPFMARTIRDAPADIVSVKVGINIVNLDSMRLRTFIPALHGFLDAIREGHPTTPLLLVSPIFCGIHESTPGPGAIDPDSLGTDQIRFIATGAPGDTRLGRLTLQAIRQAMIEVVEHRTDSALHLIDGTTLYGAADAAVHPLPDGLHPDSATHDLIGTRFARALGQHVKSSQPTSAGGDGGLRST